MIKRFIRLITVLSILFVLIGLNACSTPYSRKDGPPNFDVDVSKIPDAKPVRLPKSRYGNRSYTVKGKHYHVLQTTNGYDKRGIASWYGTKFHGRLTSTHEAYNMFAMTAASPVLPIPSFVRVKNLSNGRSVIVKVNDRGPFATHRILDLSYVAAKKLGYAARGTALVEVTSINSDNPYGYPLSRHATRLAMRNYPRHWNKVSRRPMQLAMNSSRNSRLFLQAGAFHHLKNAESFERHLHLVMNQHLQIVRRSSLYRVQVGPLNNASEYLHIKRELRHLSA